MMAEEKGLVFDFVRAFANVVQDPIAVHPALSRRIAGNAVFQRGDQLCCLVTSACAETFPQARARFFFQRPEQADRSRVAQHRDAVAEHEQRRVSHAFLARQVVERFAIGELRAHGALFPDSET